MAMPWPDDDDLDDEGVEQVDWTEANPTRFDRDPRVQKSRQVAGVMYELCARAGLHWIRRTARTRADDAATFDGPLSSERDAQELWEKIMNGKAV
ncbi:hypothetical protein ACFWYW_56035 [Nonomuraea sp. NPDC059023]|uniref:hypothetical protein n=1 Tax=unclassified Nonomuraea TaxID=2593643 RepID=UPI0036A3CBDD